MDKPSIEELFTLLKETQPHIQDPEVAKRVQDVLDKEAARKKALSDLYCDIFNGKNRSLRLE